MKEFNFYHQSELARTCLHDICVFRVYTNTSHIFANTVADIIQERLLEEVMLYLRTSNMDQFIGLLQDLITTNNNLKLDESYKLLEKVTGELSKTYQETTKVEKILDAEGNEYTELVKGNPSIYFKSVPDKVGVNMLQECIFNSFIPALDAISTTIIYELQLAEILLDLGAIQAGVIQYHLDPEVIKTKPYKFIRKAVSFKTVGGSNITVHFKDYDESRNTFFLELEIPEKQNGEDVILSSVMSFPSDKLPLVLTALRNGNVRPLLKCIKVKQYKSELDEANKTNFFSSPRGVVS